MSHMGIFRRKPGRNIPLLYVAAFGFDSAMDRHRAVQQPEEGIFVIPKEVFPWTYPRSISMQSSQFPLCRAHSSALAQLSWLVQKLLVWDSNMYYLSPLDLEEPASSMR